MEMNIDNASKRISDIHLSKNSGDNKENDDPDEADQQQFNDLVMKAKRLIGEGNIEGALKLNKKALGICYSEKLAKKIKKMEDYIKAHADDSEEDDEDNGMLHLGKGFYLYRDLYNNLYAHQQEGVLWLWSLFRRKKGGILGDDMGLGKTIQIISFLSGMFDMQKVKSVLIVLPVAVMVNWEKEFQKWAPGLKVVAYHGNSKREKERALARVQRRGGVCLTTYGLVVTSWEQIGQQDGREFVWDYMILDEGHKIKNPTKTSKGVHAIPAHNRIILTGTPVQNNLKELWSLFDFVHQGSLLGLQKTFKMEFENPITRAREKDATLGEKKLGMEMAESLKKIIAPYFLRRTKAEVKEREKASKDEPDSGVTHAVMPTMTRKNDLIVWTFLRDTQLKIYQDFLSLDSVKELLMTTKSPLVALNVLKKICDHPRLLSTRACAQLGIQGDEGLDDDILETEEGNLSAVTRIQHIADNILINESGKLLFLVELLDRLKAEGHRCLVFSQSRKMLDIMQKVITNKGHKLMRLDGTIAHVQERENRIQKFQTDPSYTVFLLTTQVGGVGLTLTAADRVVIFDPSWNPATDAQAVDRVFRIGQDKNVVIYRLITCGTVEEKIYRRQIFKDSITRQTTGNAKNPYRYFSKYELKELFTLDDPHSSTTQQQLEQMHSGQRLTDPSLDEHIAYLYSLDMFGLSDHDLMFSHGNEAGDEQDVDDTGIEPENDYIQHRVQKAREIIQMESSQQCTLEERLGKSTQQSGGGEVGTKESYIKNQFSTWDFPKPGTSQADEESEAEEASESAESSYHSGTSDHADAVHIVESPQRTFRPNMLGQTDTIDLTSPVVKQEIKQEPDIKVEPVTMEYDRTPKREQNGTPKLEQNAVKHEIMDTVIKSPFTVKQFIKNEDEPMEIGTPKRQPLAEYVNSDPNIGDARMTPETKTPGKQGTPKLGLFKTTPISAKRDRSIIHEEIIISPDATKPLIQTRPPSSSNLSVMSLASTFQPNFHSTICHAVESPDFFNQSHNSKNWSGNSPGGQAKMDAKSSPSRKPFQALVAESPDNSFASSGKSRHLSSKSSSTDGNSSCCVESEGENDDEPVIIDDSVVVSEGEEKENIAPGNISVQDINNILQKSLGNTTDHSFNESPVVKKSRRKSTAYRRRVIESSDEDENDDNIGTNISLPVIGLNSSGNEKSNESLTADAESKETDQVFENNNEKREHIETQTTNGEIEHQDYNNDSDMYANNEENDDKADDVKSNINDDNNDSIVEHDRDEVAEINDDEDKVKDNVVSDDAANDGEVDNNDENDDVDDEMGEEESEEGEEEEEIEEFEDLPETDQIRYNELVEAGRIYCGNKQYEEGQACVLQALEIFADPELQQTSMTLQRKIMKQRQRQQMQKEQNMQT